MTADGEPLLIEFEGNITEWRRKDAENKVWSRLGELKTCKSTDPHVVIGVIGCMAERDGVAEERPRQADEAQRGEAHHQCVERVLRTNHPAVKEAQGGGHHQDESGGDEQPGGVGTVDSGQRKAPPWIFLILT